MTGTKIQEAVDELLTEKQVAGMFSASTQTIIAWRKDFGLPVVRITGDERDTIRYNEQDVREWAEKYGKKITKNARTIRKSD